MDWRRSSGPILAALLLTLVPTATAAQGEAEVLRDVPTIVAVVDPASTPDFPAGSIMRADCDVLVRVPAGDGSWEEFMSCTLSDEPVMIPERQGTPPTSTLLNQGGECIWISDYRGATDGSEVYASAFEVVVTPSGRVHAWSRYPAEPLECAPQVPPTAEPTEEPAAISPPPLEEATPGPS